MPAITGVMPAIFVITQLLQMPCEVPDTLIKSCFFYVEDYRNGDPPWIWNCKIWKKLALRKAK